MTKNQERQQALRIQFKLTTHGGYAGELHAFWNDKPVPRKGETIKLNNVFAEGIFLPAKEAVTQVDNLKQDAKKLRSCLREMQWTVGEVIKNSRDGEVQLLIVAVNELLK